MIHRVRIQNFKSLRSVTVELEKLTVFVGGNGSGKTSVLEAIFSAVQALTRDPQKVFIREQSGDWIYTRGGSGDLFIHCETDGGAFALHATPPKGHIGPEVMHDHGRWNYRAVPSGAPLTTALDPARRTMLLRLNAAVMARPSYSRVHPPRIARTGAGLASVLAYMRLTDPEVFNELEAQARTLIPELRRIRFLKATVRQAESELVVFGKDTVQRTSHRPYQGELILLDFDHVEDISAQNASEGTILMLGLLAVLLGPTRPQILLLDDIEHGLHPLAQKQLVEVIGQILEKFPDVQLLATAHSPYLLNYLAPEQVRIMAAGPDGYARCGRLTDHPKFPTWKEEMAPGELWSLFGEKWLAEKEAVS